MKNSISLYPRLHAGLASTMFTLSVPAFSYTKDGEEHALNLETEMTPFGISDPKGYWCADDYDLILTWNITCGYTKILFDHSSTCSIACHDAKIGIALQWCSKDSKQRGSIPIGIIEARDNGKEFNFKHSFDKAMLRGDVDFSFVLYLKESGHPDENERHFANTPGTIIGEMEPFSLQLDGNGSFFSIYEASKPGEPLWSVEYDIDDPSTDSFSEMINITINNAHRNYQFLDRDNKKFDQQLFIEVMSNAMITIIETIRQQDENFDCLEDPTEGSVAQAVKYFRDVLGWNLSTPLTLNQSVRKYMEDKITQL